MIMNSSKSTRAVRLVQSLAIAAVATFAVSACSGDGSTDDPSPSATVDATQASVDLEAGLAAHAAGDLDTATTEYNKVLAADATNKFALYNMALIDESNANYGLAEEKYRAALATDPAYEPALFNLAILRTSADPAEAITLYQSAVAANDQDAAAWLNLGLLQRANGQAEVGDENVLRAIALNPELTDPATG